MQGIVNYSVTIVRLIESYVARNMTLFMSGTSKIKGLKSVSEENEF